MADDSQIRIGLSIDTSGLSAAQSAASSSANQISQAYERVAAAALEVQNAQSRHRDILKQYQTEVFDAATSTKLLAENLAENAAASLALSNAKRTLTAIVNQEGLALKASANAALEDSVAQNADADATIRAISGRQAGAASIGILEGRMMSGNRAAAAFLSTTLGLGPALEAAFPVIGLIALGDVAVQVGKSLYDAFDMGGERARRAAEDFREATNSLNSMNDEINVEIDRLAIANEKLEHKPTNGMKLAIDEAILDADRLDQKLDSVLKKIEESVKGLSGSVPQQALGLRGGTGYEHTMVSEHARHLSEQASIQGQLNESISYGNSLLIRKNELQEKIADRGTSPAVVNDYRTELDAVQRLMAAQQQEKQFIQSTIDLQKAQDSHQKIADQADAAALQKKAAEAQAKVVGEFVSESIASYRDMEREQKRISQEVHDYGSELLRTELQDQVDAIRHGEEADRRAAEEWKKDHELKLKQLQDETEATLKAATVQEDSAKRRIEYEEKLGVLRPKQGFQQQISAVNTAESTQVGALKNQQAAYTPGLSEADTTKYKEIQDKITQIQQQAAAQREQITQQETLQEVSAWQHAMQQMTSAIVSATNTWLTTHKSFGNSFVDAGKKLAVSFIDDLLQMGLKWAENEALMTALHIAGIAQRNSADAAGTATATATKAAQSAAAVGANAIVAESDAGVAAATAAAMAAVGGPAAAAAAGAAMLGIMQPFVLAASMDTGGVVPGRTGAGVPILAHGGEEVVQGPIASAVASALQGGNGKGGGGHTFNSTYAPQISVLDGRGLDSFAQRAGDVHAAEMKRQARRANHTL